MSLSFITSNPQILSGEPIIAGTRTPVRAIVESVRLGIPPEEIPEHLPYLSMPQVMDALRFYKDNEALIEEYIALNRVPEELIHPAVRHLSSHE